MGVAAETSGSSSPTHVETHVGPVFAVDKCHAHAYRHVRGNQAVVAAATRLLVAKMAEAHAELVGSLHACARSGRVHGCAQCIDDIDPLALGIEWMIDVLPPLRDVLFCRIRALIGNGPWPTPAAWPHPGVGPVPGGIQCGPGLHIHIVMRLALLAFNCQVTALASWRLGLARGHRLPSPMPLAHVRRLDRRPADRRVGTHRRVAVDIELIACVRLEAAVPDGPED